MFSFVEKWRVFLPQTLDFKGEILYTTNIKCRQKGKESGCDNQSIKKAQRTPDRSAGFGNLLCHFLFCAYPLPNQMDYRHFLPRLWYDPQLTVPLQIGCSKGSVLPPVDFLYHRNSPCFTGAPPAWHGKSTKDLGLDLCDPDGTGLLVPCDLYPFSCGGICTRERHFPPTCAVDHSTL